jgi:CHAT domain-containing protein
LKQSSSHSTIHALAQVTFASLVDRTGGDLNAAIALCRAALRRLRLRARLDRDFARLALCDLLADRARLDASHARRDLAEATRLCRRLRRSPASHIEAVRRLPTLLALSGADAATVGEAYRRAFAELSVMSGGGAGDLAADWASWATTNASAAEAGEAHWCWIRAVADDARRRPLRAEKERRLAQFLGLAGRTGECLVAAGRARDAAVALDLGRAMLLTERMHRERVGIAPRLAEAGRTDLAHRWREAQERIAQADQAAFASGSGPSRTMIVGGRRFQPGFTSSDHLALADVEQLLREISQVPGCEDVDAPPDYDDLRGAASEGPIVYLNATPAGTQAVIVTDAAQPLVVTLKPTRDELEALARGLVDANDAGEVMDLMSPLILSLWPDLMEPVAAHLAPGSLVTLIPLGALSLLPLHVAGLEPDDSDVWHDRSDGLVFRYAPNARVLGRAQAQARSLAGRPLRVLTVDVPDAYGQAPLPCAPRESAGVVARFGTLRTERPSPASRGTVLRAMDTCGIWHFACHGLHDRVEPLASSLVLTDGRLTLREIFARPAGLRRLAVLSACRAAAPDEGLLDEVVSFPSALLQSGVAGVVCSQSDIVDRAAMLLVLRFFAELEHDDTPPRALARAQAWLRTATNEQIHADLPDAYPLPSGYSPADLASWNEEREFIDPICWASLSYSGA